MKDYDLRDRPREKLQSLGSRSLTNVELLAILIGSGSKHENVLHLSARIMKDLESDLNRLAKLSVNQLCKYPGIGKVKATSIVAALELGRRRDDLICEKRIQLKSSRDVYELMQSTYRDLEHEESWALFTDSSLRLISKHLIGRGGVDFTPVDLKVVLRKALECSAKSVILTHNHPSGNLTASEADLALTEHIACACAVMDLQLNDHVIFGHSDYLSMRDEDCMPPYT